MGTIWVRELTGGLDTRRMPETTPGGSLIRAVDGHINRGGEFEQRAAFVLEYSVPPATKSLAAGKRSLVVFGHGPSLTVPVGLQYQQLAHPDGTTALIRVVSTDLYAGLIYAIGLYEDGSQHHFYDGVLITDWVDGRSRAGFSIGGAPGGKITNITVGGINIIAAPVPWKVSNEATAAAVAAAINDFGSTPDYTAVVHDDDIDIMSAVPGVASNGLPVLFSTEGELIVTPNPGTMANGAAIAAGTFQSGQFARTIGSKVYALSGPNLHSSGVQLPKEWDTAAPGASFKDLSSYSSGAEDLIGFAPYLQFIAVFAPRIIQVWYVDPDPDLDKRAQTLANTGTEAPRSITQFGDNDLFYCDASGLRSLRARDSSNAAATSDIGIPIDTLIKAKLKRMTPFERSKIIGLIEPDDGRFWLIFSDEIFVFSYFPGSKISAWSSYLPTTEVDGEQVPFTIDDAAVYKGRIYVRSIDNKIYSYGGLESDLQFDSTSPDLWLPYLDGDKPTMQKHFKGIDAACEGQWEVRLGMQPTDIDVSDKIGMLVDTTFNADKIGGQGSTTHFSLRLRGAGSGAKKVSSLVMHYQADDEED